MKKRFSYIFLFLFVMLLSFPVLAAKTKGDIIGCNAFLGRDDLLMDYKIASIVHLIFLIIQIAVPIILVVFGMIDLLKAVIASKDDEIKKAQMTFVKRLIAAAIVFFVFVIVKLVISLVADDSKNLINCVNCFVNGPDTSTCSKNGGA